LASIVAEADAVGVDEVSVDEVAAGEVGLLPCPVAQAVNNNAVHAAKAHFLIRRFITKLLSFVR